MNQFFIQSWKGKNEWWRYLIGFIIIFGGVSLFQMPLAILIYYKVYEYIKADVPEGAGFAETLEQISQSINSDPVIIDAVYKMNLAGLDINLNWGLFLILFSFVGGIFALWLAFKPLHLRSIKSLLTSRPKLDRGRIFFGFAVWGAILLVLQAVGYLLDPDSLTLQFQPVRFLVLVLICLIIMPFQTSLEEIIFRGYLMQGLGQLFSYPIVAVALSGAVFGAMHFVNPEVAAFGFWKMAIIYIGMGIFFGLVTAMDEGLELALGLHFANNFFTATLITFEGSALQTYALFKAESVSVSVLELTPMLVFIGLAAWRYRWKDWNKLFIKITKPVNNSNDENITTFMPDSQP